MFSRRLESAKRQQSKRGEVGQTELAASTPLQGVRLGTTLALASQLTVEETVARVGTKLVVYRGGVTTVKLANSSGHEQHLQGLASYALPKYMTCWEPLMCRGWAAQAGPNPRRAKLHRRATGQNRLLWWG